MNAMIDKRFKDTGRTQWVCLVSGDGKTQIMEDRMGMEFISRFTDILSYARALLRSRLTRLVFHRPGTSAMWYRVTLQQGAQTPAGQFVIVEITMIVPPFAMTLRELDILTLIAAGLSNEMIASRLYISTRTVAKHTERLLHKTGFRSRAGLAGYAVDQGYIRLPTPGGLNDSQLSASLIENIAHDLSVSDLANKENLSRRVALRPLTIGIPVIERGRGFADSVELIQGARLAVAEINRSGGVSGRAIQLFTTPYQAGNETEKIAAYYNMINHEVDAIISGYACYSPEAHDMVGESGIPCLHVATLNHAVERVRFVYNNLFQSCATDIHYAIGLERFIRHIAQKFAWITARQCMAIIKPAGAELDIGIDYLCTRLKPEGWNIRTIHVSADTDKAWNATLTELHRIQPSVIVLASFFVEDAIRFQKIFIKKPVSGIIYNIYSPSVPAYLQQLGNCCDGVVWATTSGTCHDFFGKRFRRYYRNYFHESPGDSQAGLAYDRVNILAASWSRCIYPRIFSNIVTDLRHSINRGVNGAYFFGRRQQCLASPDNTLDLSISQAHLICQIQHGRNVIIAPDFCADGTFRLPCWI